jgi:hypothetical protein
MKKYWQNKLKILAKKRWKTNEWTKKSEGIKGPFWKKKKVKTTSFYLSETMNFNLKWNCTSPKWNKAFHFFFKAHNNIVLCITLKESSFSHAWLVQLISCFFFHGYLSYFGLIFLFSMPSTNTKQYITPLVYMCTKWLT